jgi:glucokinase
VVVCVDIGGSKVEVALASETGRLLGAPRRRPPDPDPRAALAAIATDARALLAAAGSPGPQAIGISAPGPLAREAGRLDAPPNLPGWRGVEVCRPLSEALSAPAFLENDANAAALAEWRFGAGQGASRLVYLTLSTGLGAGLVLDDRLYRGRGDQAGELGHVAVEEDGLPCACGLRGCLEAYVGGRAWTRHLREALPETSSAVVRAGGRERVGPEQVVAAAREGDPASLRELARFVHYLARGVAMVVMAFAPDVIVLGTIATAAGEALCFEPLRAQVARRIWPQAGKGLRIVPAGLGERGPALAGLCAALQGRGALAPRIGPPQS